MQSDFVSVGWWAYSSAIVVLMMTAALLIRHTMNARCFDERTRC